MFRVRLGSEPTQSLALPDKPSIAVLPFQSMSEEPEQHHFAEGLTEDVITGLSRLKWLFVIAHSSTVAYKNRAADMRQIGRELGVRYLLIGRVRWEKQGATSRVRVEPELLQVAEGHAPTTQWEQPFDAPLTDVFQVQADIAKGVQPPHEALALDIVPIDAVMIGENVFYVQESIAGDPKRVLDSDCRVDLDHRAGFDHEFAVRLQGLEFRRGQPCHVAPDLDVVGAER